MIHWFWLIPAGMIGGTIALLIMAALIISKEEDE